MKLPPRRRSPRSSRWPATIPLVTARSPGLHARRRSARQAGAYAVLPAGYCESLYFQLTGGADSGLACTTVLDHVHKHALAGERRWPSRGGPTQHRPRPGSCASARLHRLPVRRQCHRRVRRKPAMDSGHPDRRRALRGDQGYDQTYTRLTWGAAQLGGYDWWGECVEEVYAVIPSEARWIRRPIAGLPPAAADRRLASGRGLGAGGPRARGTHTTTPAGTEDRQGCLLSAAIVSSRNTIAAPATVKAALRRRFVQPGQPAGSGDSRARHALPDCSARSSHQSSRAATPFQPFTCAT